MKSYLFFPSQWFHRAKFSARHLSCAASIHGLANCTS
jgi:hypothetical protein